MSGKKGGQQQQQQDFKFNFGGDGKAPNLDLIKAVQGQLGNLVGRSSGYLESLPKPTQERIAVLKLYQSQRETVDEEFQKELRALEEKYEKLFQPFYEKRAKIVSGEVEPSSEELESSKEFLPQVEEGKEAAKTDAVEKGIPQFWFTALSHSEFRTTFSEKDEEILKYLTNVTARNIEGGPSFEIVFTFASNPFFSETVLKKTYHLEEQKGSVIFDHIDPVQITWAEGKSPLVHKVTRQVKGGAGKRGGRGGRGGKQGGGARSVTVEEPCESFFHFFNPENTPLDVVPQDDEDEDEFEPLTLEEVLENDHELGMLLKDEIIPNAVLYFTGEAEDDQDDYDMQEFGEDGEEGEEGEYKSDEDDDFDPNAAAGAPKPEDCKQQ